MVTARQSSRLNTARATSVHRREDGVTGGCSRADPRGLWRRRLFTPPVLVRWRSPVRLGVLLASALLAIAMLPGVAGAVTAEPLPIPLPIADPSGDDPGEVPCPQPSEEPTPVDVEPVPVPLEPIPSGNEIAQPIPLPIAGASGDDPGEVPCPQPTDKPPPVDAELPLGDNESDEIQPFLRVDTFFKEIGETIGETIVDVAGQIGDFVGGAAKFVKEVGGYVWKVGETLWTLPFTVFNGLVELCGILTEGESDSYSESDLDAGQCVNDFLGLTPVLGIGIDLSNAALSTFRGNFDDAAFSGLAAVPIVGTANPKILRYIDNIAKSTPEVLASKLKKLEKFAIWKRVVSEANPVRQHLDHGDELATIDEAFGFARGVHYRTPGREFTEVLPGGQVVTGKLGSKARVVSKTFDVRVVHKSLRPSYASAKYQSDKRKVAKIMELWGKPGDELGHGVADRFGGPMSITNITPQHRLANIAQKGAERIWADFGDDQVRVTVQHIFNKGNIGGRPDAYLFPWRLNGKRMKPFFIPNDESAQFFDDAIIELKERLGLDDWVRLFALDAGISMAEIAIVTGDLSWSSNDGTTHGIETGANTDLDSTVTTSNPEAANTGTGRVELSIGDPDECDDGRDCYWFDIDLYDFSPGPYNVKCGTQNLPESRSSEIDPLNHEIWLIDPQVEPGRLDRTCRFWLEGNRVYVEVDGVRSNYLLWNPSEQTS